jgi:hypothetical protein
VRLPHAPDQVYLDATGLSMAVFTVAEKEQERSARLQSARDDPAFSGGHC